MKKIFSARGIALIGIMSAIAAAITLLDFPLPFIAPPFYKFDFSEVPVLIVTFAMGPIAGVIVELIKILLNLLINGTVTMYVGELANFVIGCAFILPAGIVYKFNHTKKGAVIGIGVGIIFMVIVGALINAFILIPTYSKIYGMPLESIIELGGNIFSYVTSLFTFVIFCTVPFNLIKGTLCGLLTFFLYKKVSFIIKDFRDKRI